MRVCKVQNPLFGKGKTILYAKALTDIYLSGLLDLYKTYYSCGINTFPISSATRANSGIPKVSPRTFSGSPAAVRHAIIWALESVPKPEDKPFTSVLRRWAKLARTVRKKSFSSAMGQGGAFRQGSVITAEVTLGWGIKQEGGTSNRISGWA